MKPYLKLKKITQFALAFLIIGLFVLSSCNKEEQKYHETARNTTYYVSLDNIKQLYKGKDINLADQFIFNKIIIDGVVVSDESSGNNPVKEGVVIQDGTAGLFVLLDEGSLSLKRGDEIEIKAGKDKNVIISSVDGNVAIKGIKSSDISIIHDNQNVEPPTLKMEDFIKKFSKYEGSVVSIISTHVKNYTSNETYSGNKILEDATGSSDATVILHTESSSEFANSTLHAYANYTGIAVRGSDSSMQLWMRDLSDYEEYSVLYPDFPETFASNNPKIHYASDTRVLNSGKWLFSYGLLKSASNDNITTSDGSLGVRFGHSSSVLHNYLEMEFDLNKGASKVSMDYAMYNGDPGCQWVLEYSTDSGNSWNQIGDTVNVATDLYKIKTAVFKMDIHGKVRFRVDKFTFTNEGRLNMDNFAIYEND